MRLFLNCAATGRFGTEVGGNTSLCAKGSPPQLRAPLYSALLFLLPVLRDQVPIWYLVKRPSRFAWGLIVYVRVLRLKAAPLRGIAHTCVGLRGG